MASLGNDLVIDLGVDSRGVGKGFNSARRELDGFKRDVGGFNRSTKTAQRGLLELSRGVEDFAVSFGTSGFSGGLRGAANNLSQLAFIMGGPFAGAIAGVSVAGVSMWQAFNKGADGAIKKAETYTDVLNKSQERIKTFRDSQDRLFEQGLKLQQAGGVKGSEIAKLRVGQRQGLIDQSRKQAAEIGRRLFAERASQKERDAERAELLGRPQLEGQVGDKIGARMRELDSIDKEALRTRERLKASAEALSKVLGEDVAKLREFKNELEIARKTEELQGKNDKATQEKRDRERGIAANDRLQARFQKERDKKAANEKREQDKLKREAESIRRASRSPLQKLRDDLKNIDRLSKAGVLDPRVAARAENQAVDAFRRSELGKLKPNGPPPLPGLATQGSAEAARALARFRASGLVKNTKQNPNKNLEAINKQVLAVLKEIQIDLQEDEDQVVAVFGE